MSITKDYVYIGTELKLNISIGAIGDMHMNNYDFIAEFYCTPNKSVKIQKQQAIQIDEDNYMFLLDTNAIGVGDLKCKITVFIPDADFEDALRTEVARINTNIVIERV